MDEVLMWPLIVVGVLFAAFIITALTGTIHSSTEPLFRQALIARLNDPNSLVKIAVLGDASIKATAENLIESTTKTPHELAISPVTTQLTVSDIENLDSFLSSKGPDTGIFSDLNSKCRGWLSQSNLGDTEFTISREVVNSYYRGLQISGGDWKTKYGGVNPTSISEYLQEHIDTVNAICDEAGCPNTRTCASCWNSVEEFREAERMGDWNRATDIEIQMVGGGCAESCGEVCITIHSRMKLIEYLDVFNPELRKTFISNGISLN